MILFIFGLSFAGEYVNDAADGIIRVKMNLNMSSATNAALDSAITGYMREAALSISLMTKSRMLIDTIFTDTGVFIVSYDTTIEVIQDVIWKDDSLYGILRFKPKSEWWNIDAEMTDLFTETGVNKHPKYYDWDNGYIFFYPIPALYDTMIVTGYAKPTTVEDSLALVDISVIHRPAIVYYATSCLATRLGLLDKAAIWDKKYEQYITNLNASTAKATPSE